MQTRKQTHKRTHRDRGSVDEDVAARVKKTCGTIPPSEQIHKRTSHKAEGSIDEDIAISARPTLRVDTSQVNSEDLEVAVLSPTLAAYAQANGEDREVDEATLLTMVHNLGLFENNDLDLTPRRAANRTVYGYVQGFLPHLADQQYRAAQEYGLINDLGRPEVSSFAAYGYSAGLHLDKDICTSHGWVFNRSKEVYCIQNMSFHNFSPTHLAGSSEGVQLCLWRSQASGRTRP
jgi:hypothetical protein